MRKLILLICLAISVSVSVVSAQEIRWRNVSVETVAGRRLHLENGAQISYFRDGRLHIRNGRGREHTGRWEIGRASAVSGHSRSIELYLNNGERNTFYYFQEGDTLYHVRYTKQSKEFRMRVVSVSPL